MRVRTRVTENQNLILFDVKEVEALHTVNEWHICKLINAILYATIDNIEWLFVLQQMSST